MNFDKQICFLDLETTGTNPQKDRIVEIAIVKCDADLLEFEERVKRINPTVIIPSGAIGVHGITNEEVKDCPTFQQLAKGIFDFISGCDIAGYNSNNYDVPMLYAEFIRAGIIWDYSDVRFIDVCNVFKIKESRTLSAAVKFYCDKEHEDAHGALADVNATIDVLRHQLDRYPDFKKMNIHELALFSNYDKPILDISGKFTTDSDGDIIFNFGQHKGKKAKSELSYLDWMLNKGDFTQDTKNIILKILKPQPIN